MLGHVDYNMLTCRESDVTVTFTFFTDWVVQSAIL